MVDIAFERDRSLTDIPTLYQLVAEGVAKKLPGVHRQAIVKINVLAKKNFAAKIERPAHSATLGHARYGRNRVSGEFRFGKGLTFVGKQLRKSKTVQGFGYPDETRADQKTKGVWRFLEEGAIYPQAVGGRPWPFKGRAAFFVPGADKPFIKAQSGRDDQIFPGVGQKVEFQTKTIKARFYIKEAVESVRVSFVEPSYAKILAKALQEANK